MLRNVCRDELRRRGCCAATVSEALASSCTAREEDPARTALERDAARAAREAMARLPADDRDILAMRVHGGLPFEEIAATAGITVDCARKRAQRALDRLRQELS
jgi:RNA polymerase sigma factor (sigma-70 family)